MNTQAMERQKLIEVASKKNAPNSPGPFTTLSNFPETPTKSPPTNNNLYDSGYSASGLDSTPRRPLRHRTIIRPANPPPLEALRPLTKSSPESLTKLIHGLVILVVGASLAFGVLVGNHTRSNLKYEAIQFGKEKATNPGMAVTDSDSGDLLGGKRAAIQFYHDRQRQLAADDLVEDSRVRS